MTSVNVYQNRVRIGDPHTNSDTSTRVSMLFSIYDALVKRDQIGCEGWGSNLPRDGDGADVL